METERKNFLKIQGIGISAQKGTKHMVEFIKAFLLVMFIASPIYAETKILPLGDSITANVTTHSYRYYLWNLLQAEGYNVDFVGNQINQKYANFDPDHEGHSGWRADEIAASLPGWLKNYTPDIVLLHIGHNDFFQSQPGDSTLDEIKDIIDLLQADNPKVTILLAQIVYPNWPHAKWTAFNKQIPDLATSKTTAESLVIPVNQNEFFIPAEDTFDKAHPNDGGNLKIAQQWYKSIVSLLSPNSGLAPPQGLKIAGSDQ